MDQNKQLSFKILSERSKKPNPIPDKLYFRIKEVSKLTGLEPYVLRYWETEFRPIKPVRTKSKHRLYRRKDLNIIFEVKRLLYEEQYTIAGAKKRLGEIIREGKNKADTEGNADVPDILLDTIKELKSLRKLLTKK
ncbi:MAG: MerR family transcriptional regulator [Proteobacteria bacterium]|nr:MerR family transcriptional regulator [Pseudomonadota bacterium]